MWLVLLQKIFGFPCKESSWSISRIVNDPLYHDSALGEEGDDYCNSRVGLANLNEWNSLHAP